MKKFPIRYYKWEKHDYCPPSYGEVKLTAVYTVKSAKDVKQGRLTAARLAKQKHHAAIGKLKRYSAKGVNRYAAEGTVGLFDVFNFNHIIILPLKRIFTRKSRVFCSGL